MRNIEEHKRRYDEVLEKQSWKQVRAVVFELNGIFPIQCAVGYFPERDLNGKVYQVLGVSKKTPDIITLSSFAAGGRSYVSVCWLVDSDSSCGGYVDAMLKLPFNKLPAILGTVMLQTSENCHFSPVWYDNLPEHGKDWVCLQTYAGLPTLPFMPVPGTPIEYISVPYFEGMQVESIKRIP